MVMGYITGQTVVNLRVIGKIIKLQDSVFIIGPMEEHLKVIGDKTICMVKEFINGLMVENMKGLM